jgi:hypothetical protein
MPTAAKSAFGVTVTIGGVAIPEIKNLTPVGFTSTKVDVTAHDSTGGWGVELPVIKQGNPITLEANWVPGNPGHAALLAAALNLTSVAIVITYNLTGTPKVWTFNAFVTEFGCPDVPVRGVLPLRCILSPDQAMAFA